MDPVTGAQLSTDEIVAMCDELIEAHTAAGYALKVNWSQLPYEAEQIFLIQTPSIQRAYSVEMSIYAETLHA